MQINLDSHAIANTALILAGLCTLFSLLRVARLFWQSYKANRAYRRLETVRQIEIAALGRQVYFAKYVAEWRKDRDKRGLDSI